MLCRVTNVSVSGYYLWRTRLTKPPCLKKKNLATLIRNCYFENRRRYGSRRIKAALQKSGVEVGRWQIRRLMSQQNLKAIQPKSFKPKTTDSRGTLAAPNLLAQIKVEECAIGKIVVGDITYVPMRNGRWCYLAVWQDKITRRIIGWSLQDSMTAELLISALHKAIRKGLIKAEPSFIRIGEANMLQPLFAFCYSKTVFGNQIAAKEAATITPRQKAFSLDSKPN
jgi:transposase InsO family protein